MSKEKKIKISVNEEDVQNLIDCYEKDIEYIKKLEEENKEQRERIDKAIEYVSHNPHPEWEQVVEDVLVSGKIVLNILRG